jgi:hypothetical protein
MCFWTRTSGRREYRGWLTDKDLMENKVVDARDLDQGVGVSVMALFGYLCVVNSMAILFWWLIGDKPNAVYAAGVAAIALFVGLACIFNERVTEITVAKVGSIKTTAMKVKVDAEEIAQMKERIQGQAATVDLVAGKAAEAERLLAFTSTVVAAQNDDRKAFDQLRAWAEDASNPFGKKADQAWNTMVAASWQPIGTHYGIQWDSGDKPEEKGLGELKGLFNKEPDRGLKLGYLGHIADRQEIPLRARLEFFVEVMRDTQSVKVLEVAGECFTAIAQLENMKRRPLDTEKILEWWEKNKDSEQLGKQAVSPTP